MNKLHIITNSYHENGQKFKFRFPLDDNNSLAIIASNDQSWKVMLEVITSISY